jgi:hypothetical protein
MMKINNTYTGILAVALAVAVPTVASAQTTIMSLIALLGNVLNMLIPIIITLAVVFFFWGLALFLLKADEEKEKGRSIMLYGVLTLFVMVAIWGLVGILANTLGISVGGTVNLPTVGR